MHSQCNLFTSSAFIRVGDDIPSMLPLPAEIEMLVMAHLAFADTLQYRTTCKSALASMHLRMASNYRHYSSLAEFHASINDILNAQSPSIGRPLFAPPISTHANTFPKHKLLINIADKDARLSVLISRTWQPRNPKHSVAIGTLFQKHIDYSAALSTISPEISSYENLCNSLAASTNDIFKYGPIYRMADGIIGTSPSTLQPAIFEITGEPTHWQYYSRSGPQRVLQTGQDLNFFTCQVDSYNCLYECLLFVAKRWQLLYLRDESKYPRVELLSPER